MTGWRIGFAAGPRKLIRGGVAPAGPDSGNPNSITQAAAIEALSGPQGEIETMMRSSAAVANWWFERVRKLPGFDSQMCRRAPSTRFPNISELIGMSLNAKRFSDGNSFADLVLNEAQVALVGGNDFGAPQMHVRLSYATSLENLNAAFDRIAALLAKLRREAEVSRRVRRERDGPDTRTKTPHTTQSECDVFPDNRTVSIYSWAVAGFRFLSIHHAPVSGTISQVWIRLSIRQPTFWLVSTFAPASLSACTAWSRDSAVAPGERVASRRHLIAQLQCGLDRGEARSARVGAADHQASTYCSLKPAAKLICRTASPTLA